MARLGNRDSSQSGQNSCGAYDRTSRCCGLGFRQLDGMVSVLSLSVASATLMEKISRRVAIALLLIAALVASILARESVRAERRKRMATLRGDFERSPEDIAAGLPIAPQRLSMARIRDGSLYRIFFVPGMRIDS